MGKHSKQLEGNHGPPLARRIRECSRKINAFNIDIRNGQESDVSDDLKKALGRKPASLKEGLKELFGF